MGLGDRYLHAHRFDVIVKIVYAYFIVFKEQVPNCITAAYTEHIRVWNSYREYCEDIDQQTMTDFNKTCKPKENKDDFVLSFHNLIRNIKQNGFNNSISIIPVDKSGFLINGAHRLSASIVLSKPAAFKRMTYTESYKNNFEFFQMRGFTTELTDLVLLEYMKIQLALNISSQVSIMTIFSTNLEKEVAMRRIFRKYCSRDGKTLYEKNATITVLGMKQLITHMYGLQPWLSTNISNMEYLFSSLDAVKIRFWFFFGHEKTSLTVCKYKIRSLYNTKSLKLSVHIPDSPATNLILAQMILNNNSLLFLNHANKGHACRRIAMEIARRSQLPVLNNLPEIYQGREDIMVDGGAVLDIFDIRQGTNIDVLFLNSVDKRLLGDKHGIDVEPHTFVLNTQNRGYPWGEEHLDANVTKWDLFYDTRFYGQCYGLKFMSLSQIISYKTKRHKPGKDRKDVSLIKNFLKRTIYV